MKITRDELREFLISKGYKANHEYLNIFIDMMCMRWEYKNTYILLATKYGKSPETVRKMIGKITRGKRKPKERVEHYIERLKLELIESEKDKDVTVC